MSSDPTPLSTERADVVADAVRSVPGVADLHAGSFGEVATYLPGRRVEGVRLSGDDADVHVVVTWDASVGDTADAVRRAAARHVTGRVDVTVEDVAAPA
ncbi:MAG: hypothetical protein Q7T56_18110 [Nocardioidaceae bacterium]|nr:hypothetical protein [Nocardioidaceae bacterium]